MRRLRSNWWKRTSSRSCRRRRTLRTTRETTVQRLSCWGERLRCFSCLQWKILSWCFTMLDGRASESCYLCAFRFPPGILNRGNSAQSVTSEWATRRRPSRIWHRPRGCATTTVPPSWSSVCSTTAKENTTNPSSELMWEVGGINLHQKECSLCILHLAALLRFQPHSRVSEAGPGWQGVLQSLQASEEAQQAVGFSGGADSGGEVGASEGHAGVA